jgi:hypothetical protein
MINMLLVILCMTHNQNDQLMPSLVLGVGVGEREGERKGGERGEGRERGLGDERQYLMPIYM